MNFFQGTNHSVTTMQLLRSTHPDRLDALITAGSDRRIRYWDLANPHNSTIIAGAGPEVVVPNLLSYQ